LKLIKPSHEVLYFPEDPLEIIEESARVCYQSHDRTQKGSAEKLTRALIKSGHHTPLEAVPVRIKFVTDRGVTHELVRHRIPGFCQESTRWVNYSRNKFDNQLTFIVPGNLELNYYLERILETESPHQLLNIEVNDIERLSPFAKMWVNTMLHAEETYLAMIKDGTSPQYARSILPNSLKSEINMFTNLRELRLIIEQRTGKGAHPDIKKLIGGVRDELAALHPLLFEDLEVE